MPKLTVLSLLLQLVHLCGCSKPLDERECDELLDHYTERLLLEERPRLSRVEVRKKQDEARELARAAPQFEYALCPELVSREQFECALSAADVDAIERCLL
jgi:hypothetical protein